MLTKATALAIVAIASPLVLIASTQEPQDARRAQTRQDTLRAEVHELRDALRRSELRAERAEARLEEVGRQLEEVLEMLDENVAQRRHRNCAPSRSMLTYYQWMDKNGHDERAETMLTHIVEATGDRPSHLNSVAWDLMTDKKTTGQFDRVALALAERMEEHGGEGLSHQYVDTVALAKFLNGHVDDAIELQRRAIDRGGDSDDYRRRLRMYEAAREQALDAGGPQLGLAAAGGSH